MLLLVRIIDWIFTLALIAIFARIIIDWIRVFAPQWRPPTAVVVIFESIYSLTDPAFAAIRRVIPPLKLGQIMLDLSPMILIFGLYIVNSLVIRILLMLV